MPANTQYPDYESMGLKKLLVRLDSGVAIVTLNDPKQRNVFSMPMCYELNEVYPLLDLDDRVRVVVLTANTNPKSPTFCSGADLTSGWSKALDPEAEREGEHAHRDGGGTTTLAIFRCRKITMVAVNGHAVGVGVTGLQLPCDFRFIWAGAKLAFPFVRRGICSEAASSYLLPRLLGHSRATALLLTGATVSPDIPQLDGLYHSILPNSEDVLPAALKFAHELADNTSMTAVALTKALLWRGVDSIEETHLLDSRAMNILIKGGDAEEGANAFKERRPVKFQDTLSQIPSTFMPWWRTIDIRHRKAKL